MPSKPRPDAPLLTIALLGILGFADAAYLTAGHYLTLPLPCSITNGCETVLTSPYSMVGPIPLALFGVAFYLSVVGLALWLYATPSPSRAHFGMLFGLTVIGLLSSIAFVAIQAFVIHAFCMYCLGSALDTLLLFGAGIWCLKTLAKTT